MKEALLLILGALISAWVGLATSKIFVFRQLKSRAVEAFIETTSSDKLVRFVDHQLLVRESMATAALALRLAGHSKAAQAVSSVAEDVTKALVDVLGNTSGGTQSHSVPTQFKINAWKMLNERKDFGSGLASLQPDRGTMLEPFW
ncbi:MAG: hypothetical protein Q8J74_09220 [Candidatus Didemnitutus sp.]|nr:hypothetical protein [Candidatus Didemnitutus sp.]